MQKKSGCLGDELEGLLKEGQMGWPLYYRSEMASTNEMAKELGKKGMPSGTLVAADGQTAGRGRRGRSWSSPSGGSIYATLLLRPPIEPQHASALTLVMGLSAAEAIRRELGLEAMIKWPNDVVVSGKKICGILTEMSAGMAGMEYLVIGVGINVNVTDFPPEITDIATSAALELKREVSRAQLLVRVLERFAKNYEIFLKTSDMRLLKKAYSDVLVNRNRKVSVLSPGQQFDGRALGIDDRGELLVEREDGHVERVYAGEVSVRGLYGYV